MAHVEMADQLGHSFEAYKSPDLVTQKIKNLRKKFLKKHKIYFKPKLNQMIR